MRLKASVARALLMLDRLAFEGVEDFRAFQEFNRGFVNPGCNPEGHGIGDIYFDRQGQFDYWAEDDDGVIGHYLFRVDKDGEVIIEELEISEDEL